MWGGFLGRKPEQHLQGSEGSRIRPRQRKRWDALAPDASADPAGSSEAGMSSKKARAPGLRAPPCRLVIVCRLPLGRGHSLEAGSSLQQSAIPGEGLGCEQSAGKLPAAGGGAPGP